MMQGRRHRRQRLLPALYRSTLRLTRRRGLRTLSRINARLFPGGQTIGLETGCDFFVPPDPHFFGYIVDHERHITRLVADRVAEGDTCVDVGANIGYFSLMMAGKCGPTGRVVAYEPEPDNFAMLQTNLELARRHGLTIEGVPAAVSDRQGAVELVPGGESTLHQVRPTVSRTGPNVVPSVNLAEDLRHRGCEHPVKFLKIDVEGHEARVLHGALDWLGQRNAQAVVLEVTPGEPAREIDTLVQSLDTTPRCWLDGRWQPWAVSEIPYRTDVLLDF